VAVIGAIDGTTTALTEVPGGVCAPGGFAAGGVHCGIKRKRRDVSLLVCTGPEPAAAAGVFTTNLLRAPCVNRNAALLAERARARVIVVNSGNANAGNGRQGDEDNDRMAVLAARALDCDANAVLTASTGGIGTPLPMEKLGQGIADAVRDLAADPAAAARAAEGILTTDTCSKEYAVEFRCGDGPGAGRWDGQGLRDDRAQHGDDAGVPYHRRGDRARPARPGVAAGGGRFL
jgi:glutamate N-acetyltransferase/amino-acid N-acetyltransferase